MFSRCGAYTVFSRNTSLYNHILDEDKLFERFPGTWLYHYIEIICNMTRPQLRPPWKWEESLFIFEFWPPEQCSGLWSFSGMPAALLRGRQWDSEPTSNLLPCTFKPGASQKHSSISSLMQQVRPQQVIKSKALERACLDTNPSSATSKLRDPG